MPRKESVHQVVWRIDKWKTNDSFATTCNVYFGPLKLFFFPKVSTAMLTLTAKKITESKQYYS